MTRMRHAVAQGTLLAGTLDLLSAFGFGAIAGRTPLRVLQGVASGPFGRDFAARGWLAGLAGLLVHYGIMAVMVTVFLLAARRLERVRAHPIGWGAAYGVLLYLVMYWIVLPLRFPALFPQTSAYGVANALFSHVVLVGLSIGWIARRQLAR